jgi:tetratricopeptide (TPR) repeat protein
MVKDTGQRLEARAYALITENGHLTNAPFEVLEAAWLTVAPALPLFIEGPNRRLQELCKAVKFFLDFTGRWDERIFLSRAAEAKAEAHGDFANAGFRAYEAGWMHFRRHEHAEVLACANRTEQYWKQAKDADTVPGFVFQIRGLAYQLDENYPVAQRAYTEALRLHREGRKERRNVAMALYGIAKAKRALHELEAAEDDYREALQIAKEAEDIEYVAMSTGDLAAVALDRNDWRRAECFSREALRLAEKIRRQDLIAVDCRRLANALAGQGKKAEGLPCACPRRKDGTFTLPSCRRW